MFKILNLIWSIVCILAVFFAYKLIRAKFWNTRRVKETRVYNFLVLLYIIHNRGEMFQSYGWSIWPELSLPISFPIFFLGRQASNGGIWLKFLPLQSHSLGPLCSLFENILNLHPLSFCQVFELHILAATDTFILWGTMYEWSISFRVLRIIMFFCSLLLTVLWRSPRNKHHSCSSFLNQHRLSPTNLGLWGLLHFWRSLLVASDVVGAWFMHVSFERILYFGLVFIFVKCTRLQFYVWWLYCGGFPKICIAL